MAGVSKHIAQANRRRTIYHEHKPPMDGETLSDEEFLKALDRRIYERLGEYIQNRKKDKPA